MSSRLIGQGLKYVLALPGVLLAAWLSKYLPEEAWWTPPLLIACVLGMAGVSISVATALNPSNRMARGGSDRRALAILAKAEAGRRQRPFALYLRPFASDGKFIEDMSALRDYENREILTEAVLRQSILQTNLEQAIVSACAGRGMATVHIGNGARKGRVSPNIESTDENWQARVETLAQAASVIVFVLSGRRGTGWEAALVARAHIDKTVLVCPPGYNEKFAAEDAYTTAVRVFAEHGQALPPYDTRGIVFFRAHGGWAGATMESPRRALSAALMHLQAQRRAR